MGIQPLFLFKVFGIPFFSFTTMAVVGAALAFWAAASRFRKRGLTSTHAVEAFVFTVLPALIAGRIAHIAYNLPYYVERPDDVLRISDGGSAFVGVFAGGLLGLLFWCRWRGQSTAAIFDVSALPVAVFASCAWLGAFWHGSQYGAPAEHVFALELRDLYGVVLARTPTQLLAASWCASIGLILLAVRHQKGVDGLECAVFLVLFGLGLGFLEFTRGDVSVYILGIRLAQWLYLVLCLAGFAVIGRRYLRV